MIDGDLFWQQFPAEDLASHNMNYIVWLFHEIIPATDSCLGVYVVLYPSQFTMTVFPVSYDILQKCDFFFFFTQAFFV